MNKSEVDIQANRQRKSRQRIRLLKMGAIAFGIILLVTVIAVVGLRAKVVDAACPGDQECLPLSKCQGHISPDFVYLCGNENVCCVGKSNSTNWKKNLLLLPKKCGIVTLQDKIAHGDNASLGEFPWMGLLGYTGPVPQEVFLCGGTLISDRYVLTAAHCTDIKNMHLASVILGELNLDTDIDCEHYDEDIVCGDPPVRYEIEKIIPHPNYNRQDLKNDIALLRLRNNITKFTDFIRPLCLPLNLSGNAEYLLSNNFTISGWGKTTTDDIGVTSILQRARIRAAEANWCDDVLPQKFRPLNRYQFCGTAAIKNQEACQGDSGGPLTMLDTNSTSLVNYLVGIISHKSQMNCGLETQPTVFTRVDSYLDWILSNMEP